MNFNFVNKTQLASIEKKRFNLYRSFNPQNYKRPINHNYIPLKLLVIPLLSGWL